MHFIPLMYLYSELLHVSVGNPAIFRWRFCYKNAVWSNVSNKIHRWNQVHFVGSCYTL